MVKVVITKSLEKEIDKTFKKESIKIFSLLLSLKENPKKGKIVGVVGNTVIKEIKYKNYRFYFITDGYKIKMLLISELQDILIKFIRMSTKKDQQKVIDEIKQILRFFNREKFN